MRKVFSWLLIVCFVFSFTLLPVSPLKVDAAPKKVTSSAANSQKNVILIGWDGAQRNHVKDMLHQGYLPNLKQLSSEGTIVDIDVIRTTDTKSGWTQILTGYNPEITGVYSNSRYQPIPSGFSIFERLENFYGPPKIFTAAIIGKKDHVDNDPPKKILMKPGEKPQPGETVKKEDGKNYRIIPGKPYYNTSKGMDLFINGLKINENVGKKTIELLNKNKDKRFFFFVHFAEIDAKGHGFGENSQQYHEALVSSDYWTGEIINKLKELGLYDDTLIYVTADHGFDEGMNSHNDAPYVFLGTNDPGVVRRGTRADITPTILDRLGVPVDNYKYPLDGHSLLRSYEAPNW